MERQLENKSEHPPDRIWCIILNNLTNQSKLCRIEQADSVEKKLRALLKEPNCYPVVLETDV